MPIPYQNRRNSRMRSNMTPPPIRNPYLSYQELQQQSVKYQEKNNSLEETQEVAKEEALITPSYPTIKATEMPQETSNLSRDLNYMLGLYPETVRVILAEVQKEFDHLDYDGSFIYDKYPDKTTLLRLAGIIYERIYPLTESKAVTGTQGTHREQLTSELENEPAPGRLPAADSTVWLFHLVTILIYNELLYRRNGKSMQ